MKTRVHLRNCISSGWMSGIQVKYSSVRNKQGQVHLRGLPLTLNLALLQGPQDLLDSMQHQNYRRPYVVVKTVALCCPVLAG